MGRGYLVFFAIIVLAGFAFAQTANKVVLKDLRTEGDLSPGGTFTLHFKFRNIYDWELKDVNIQVEGGYPFLKASPRSIGYESRIASYQDTRDFSYALSIDDAAIAGDYSFNIVVSFNAFTYNSESQAFSNTIPVTLKVSAAPLVGAGLVSSSPSEISEGQTVVLNVKVWNQGGDRARNVRLKPADTKELEVAFASQDIYVGDIENKGAKNVEVSVKVGDGVAPAKYYLPVTIEYGSDNGTSYSAGTEFEVEVQKKADFEVKNVTQGELSAGLKDMPLGLVLRNKGTKDATDVRLTLLAKYPFTPTGKTYYIPAIAPGEERPASFHVDVDDQASVQMYPVDLQVEWKEGDVEKSALERFSLVTSPPKGAALGFWEKIWLRKDVKLLAGLAGIVLFFILLFSFRKPR